MLLNRRSGVSGQFVSFYEKVNEVRDYVRPEVEEIDLALSSVLCGSGEVYGSGQDSNGEDWGSGDE